MFCILVVCNDLSSGLLSPILRIVIIWLTLSIMDCLMLRVIIDSAEGEDDVDIIVWIGAWN